MLLKSKDFINVDQLQPSEYVNDSWNQYDIFLYLKRIVELNSAALTSYVYCGYCNRLFKNRKPDLSQQQKKLTRLITSDFFISTSSTEMFTEKKVIFKEKDQ